MMMMMMMKTQDDDVLWCKKDKSDQSMYIWRASISRWDVFTLPRRFNIFGELEGEKKMLQLIKNPPSEILRQMRVLSD